MNPDPAAQKDERALLQRNETVLANIAILYYKEGLTQNEIAKRPRVSRATVSASGARAEYRRHPRQWRVVRDLEIFQGSARSLQARRRLSRFGVPGPDANPEKLVKDIRRQVARVGAMVVHDLETSVPWWHHSSAKQLNTRATVHSPLERLQPIDLAFDLATAPGFKDGVANRVNILA